MTTWVQDYLPGMEFLGELRIDGRHQPVMRSYHCELLTELSSDHQCQLCEPVSCPGCEYPDMEHV